MSYMRMAGWTVALALCSLTLASIMLMSICSASSGRCVTLCCLRSNLHHYLMLIIDVHIIVTCCVLVAAFFISVSVEPGKHWAVVGVSFSSSGCLQLVEIYWNLKTLLEILEISLNLYSPPENFWVKCQWSTALVSSHKTGYQIAYLRSWSPFFMFAYHVFLLKMHLML